MFYSTLEDIKEFSLQIKELLKKGLIRPSKGSCSSPAYMVMNETEKRRNKARMIINYEKLNQFTKTNNYFLRSKDILINLVKTKNISQNLTVNLDFGKLKMEEDSIKYTGFSTPQGFYKWIVMLFGLKIAPMIFQ